MNLAQAGVRFSIRTQLAYIEPATLSVYRVLEVAGTGVSTSSQRQQLQRLYGANTTMPSYSVHRNVDHPPGLYRRQQRRQWADGSCLQPVSTVCLRTGLRSCRHGWGQPDMALFSSQGDHGGRQRDSGVPTGKRRRDFTYIDDIVEV